MTTSGTPRIFYGWIVVAASFAALVLIFGVTYSFSAFFSSLQGEFGASRAEVSLVFSLCGFVYMGLGLFTGSIADRVGPRWLAIGGFVLLSACLIAASRAESIRMLYLAYGLGAGIGAGCIYVPAIGAVQPWFIRRRALASGLASSGIGVGTLLVPLLAVALIDASGWRKAFEILGWIVLVFGVTAGFLLDNSPAKRGLAPDGDTGSGGAKPAQAPRGITLREAIRTRAFWMLYLGCGAFSIGLFIPFVHLAPYARDHGLSDQTGVMLMGLIGAGSIAGRFSLAGIGDRIGRRGLLVAVYAVSCVCFLIWLASSHVIALATFALVFGTAYGVFVAVQPPLAMDFFGARNVSGIIGAIYTSAALAMLVGPPLAGLAFDLTRSYTLPIAISALLMVMALGCAIVLLRERPRI